MIKQWIDRLLDYLPDRESFVLNPGRRAALDEAREARQRDVLARRRVSRQETREHATHVILTHVEKDVPFPEGSVVAGYWPIGREMDIRPLLRHLAQHGYRIVLPYAQERGQPLEFREWRAHEAMELDRFQVPAPPASSERFDPDIVFVPMLSFDKMGHRLGYSSGFYDVTLAALRARKKILVVGLGFSSQEVPQVPAGRQDLQMDAMVTEYGVLDFTGLLKG